MGTDSKDVASNLPGSVIGLVRAVLKHAPGKAVNHRLAMAFHTRMGFIPREVLIRSGDSAVMVGSPNARRVSQFATLAGRAGDVLFIEPEPTNYETIQEAAEPHSNVRVDNRGAWSGTGTRELLLADDSNPADHKVPVEDIEHDNDYREENYIDSIEIDVLPLDDILAEYDITPNYVEIMVNGGELEVLQGATETLEQTNLKLLVKGHARDENTGKPINRDIAEYLREYGFKTRIGASTSAAADTDDWEKRAGDVYAWK